MKRILFQGDSITDAYRNREMPDMLNGMGEGYPHLLKARLGMDYPGQFECQNRGISGNRVVDIYARIKRDLINLAPDYLSTLIGVNDVWHELGGRHDGVDADKFEMVYDLLLTEVQRGLPQVKLIVLDPFVLQGSATVNPDEPERWEAFSREVPLRAAASRRVAEKHGAVFIPLQEKFEALCTRAPASHWLVDGVHPTAMGHEMIAREWMKAFRQIMD